MPALTAADVDYINTQLTEWRTTTWPQLLLFQVEDGCIPRFELGTRDRYVSTPECLISFLTGGNLYWTKEQIVEELKEKETTFYEILKLEGAVPSGMVSYRGTFWEHVPSQGFFAVLSYANRYHFVDYAGSQPHL